MIMKKDNEIETVDETEKIDVDVYDVASAKATMFSINDNKITCHIFFGLTYLEIK